MPTSTPPQVAGERWTIVTSEGSALIREDAFDEAQAHEAARQWNASGERGEALAVPESLARELYRRRKAIAARLEAAKRIEQRLALLSLLDEAGVAPRVASRISAQAKRAARAGRVGPPREAPREAIARRIVALEHSRTFRLGPGGDDPIIAELRELRAELQRRDVDSGMCPACAQGLSWDGRTEHAAGCPERVS